MRVFVIACLVALAASCTGASRPNGDDPLVLTLLQPNVAIEARYTEGGRTVVLRSHVVGTGVLSTIDDESGASITAMAAAATGRLAVPQLVENRKRFADALRLAAPALRILRDRLPPEVRDSSVYKGLLDQMMTIQNALTSTRRQLLQAWATEAMRELPVTPDERAKIASVLMRHSQSFAQQAPGTVGPAERGDGEVDREVGALLGPERFRRYEQHRADWLARKGGRP